MDDYPKKALIENKTITFNEYNEPVETWGIKFVRDCDIQLKTGEKSILNNADKLRANYRFYSDSFDLLYEDRIVEYEEKEEINNVNFLNGIFSDKYPDDIKILSGTTELTMINDYLFNDKDDLLSQKFDRDIYLKVKIINPVYQNTDLKYKYRCYKNLYIPLLINVIEDFMQVDLK